MKKVTTIFSLRYVFPVFLITLLVNIWYQKAFTTTIQGELVVESIPNLNLFLMMGIVHLVATGVLLYLLTAKSIGYVVKKLKLGGENETAIMSSVTTNISNVPAESKAAEVEVEAPKKYEKNLVVPITAVTIFVVALLYPAWTGFDYVGSSLKTTMYGYDVLSLGWTGIFALYVPWYFIFPAGSIVTKIAVGNPGKMLLSRILLFLFWLEGYIGVVFTGWGGSSDAGDFQITAIGPSFWLWTLLVWYILICSYIHVNFHKDKIKSSTKLISIIASIGAILLITQYHLPL